MRSVKEELVELIEEYGKEVHDFGYTEESGVIFKKIEEKLSEFEKSS